MSMYVIVDVVDGDVLWHMREIQLILLTVQFFGLFPHLAVYAFADRLRVSVELLSSPLSWVDVNCDRAHCNTYLSSPLFGLPVLPSYLDGAWLLLLVNDCALFIARLHLSWLKKESKSYLRDNYDNSVVPLHLRIRWLYDKAVDSVSVCASVCLFAGIFQTKTG